MKTIKMFKRFVIISTYVIMFCIMGNMVMPGVITETVHAQAVKGSSVVSQLSIADLKALEKAKADAKVASYKDLGLTKAEIAFSENNSFDMEALNQKADKFVKYDTKGIATLDVIGLRKSPLMLSKSNTEVFVGIVIKMIGKYNTELKLSKSQIIPAKNSISSSKSSSVQANPDLKITKEISQRGYVLNSEIQLPVQASFTSNCNIVAYTQKLTYWWGYLDRIAVNTCAIDNLKETSDTISKIASAIALACWLGAPLGILCTVGLGTIVLVISGIANSLVMANDWTCGRRGLYLNFSVGQIWNWFTYTLPVPWISCR